MIPTQTSFNRYYRIYGKKYIGQWCGEDLTLYETGDKRWLSNEEIVLELLADRRYVDAKTADVNMRRYLDWLED